MNEIEKKIERKIRQRKIAINNLGLEGNSLIDELHATIDKANINASLELYSDIAGKNKIKRYLKRIIRKVLHICLGWFIEPKLDKITEFHKDIISAVEILEQYEIENRKNYEREISSLKKDNANMLKQISVLKLQYIDILNSVNKLADEKQNGLLTDEKQKEIGKVFDNIEMDYFAFEDKFRGPSETVKEVQKDFCNYFVNKHGKVLDIGCGRGEFLELLREKNVPAMGIDLYMPFVEFCKDKGLEVKKADAIEELLGVENNSLGGIMMSHVVEHLEPSYIMTLIKLAYLKLEDGGCFVIQTPNPQCLFTYLDFYTDITHVKPVHYRSLEFLFEEEGYKKIERFNPPMTKFHNVVNQLYEESSNLNLEEFNYGMNNLNEYLSGYQDYAIIAYK